MASPATRPTTRPTPTRRRLGAVLALSCVLVLGTTTAVDVAVAPPAAAAPSVHVVKPGDTLTAIARRYGISTTTLAAWNGMASPYPLHVDGVVRLSRPGTPRRPFTSSIAPVTAAELGATYRAGCPVPPESLRRVTVSRTTFYGESSTGTLVVHANHAATTVRIFARLYSHRVPIERMVPVSAYGGSDARSMAANNTSAFNCRRTTSGTGWSEHSYGRAIDINPVQNPYVRGTTVLPEAGRSYTDRSRYQRGMVHADGAVRAFTLYGFSWGGRWSSLKDYQHFSSTNR